MTRDYGQPAVHIDHSERTFGEDKEIVFQSSGNRSLSKRGGVSVEFEPVSAGAVILSLIVRKGQVTQREPRFDSA